MASLFRREAFTSFSPMQNDPETGCRSSDQTAFQSCRQAYFLKQQNQILYQQQQSNLKSQQENSELKSEIETLKSQQASQNQAPNNSTAPKLEDFSILILIAVVVIAIIVWNKFYSKDSEK